MVFKGTATALITPFTNENIDFVGLDRLVKDQIDSGINALVVLGTTGEPATMTASEKEQVIEAAVGASQGKVPVIVGAGSNDTSAAIYACQRAKLLGANALLVVTPYYNKCTQKGLIEHYKAIASSVDLPIICYNVPSRTGVNMLPETFAVLSKTDNIAGIKEASGNMQQVQECIRLSRGKAEVYSGEDALTVPIMAMGGAGVISVASNVCAGYMSKMTALALNGDLRKASKMQLELLPLINALFCEVNPIPVKYAASLLGYGDGSVRLPLTRLTEDKRGELDRLIKSLI